MVVKRRYESLTELSWAFASGDLNPKHYILRMGNDASHLEYSGPTPEGMEPGTPQFDEWMLARDAEARALFRGHGTADMVEACKAASIPTEWV